MEKFPDDRFSLRIKFQGGKMKEIRKIMAISVIGFFAFSGLTSAATVKGKVLFQGTAPKGKIIQMDQDEYCLEYYKGQDPPRFASIVVNENSTLQSVFVYIGKGVKNKIKSKQTVTLDQKGCAYAPRVFGMVAGETLIVKNGDKTKHNFHLLGKNKYNRSANAGKTIKRTIKKAGSLKLKKKKGKLKSRVMSKIKCDVHPWMVAYVGVMKHPFFSVTGEDGSFEIADLPEGKYTLIAWHEKLGTQTQEFSVGKNDVKTIGFTYSK
jgi:plastocyanin